MQHTEAGSLALRVAGHTADGVLPRPSLAPSSRLEGSLCLVSLPLPGRDNPWGLDAILAVAGRPDDEKGILAGSLALRALQERLQEPPPDEDTQALLPELLKAAGERVSGAQPGRPLSREEAPAILIVKAGRYHVLQSGHTRGYLLRNGVLHCLSSGVREAFHKDWNADPAHPNGSGLAKSSPVQDSMPPSVPEAPEVVSGWLEDGDALLLCTEAVPQTIGDQDIGQAALIAHSPHTVAIRLAEEARQRSGRNASVAVLFAGVGPALAYRLRAGWSPHSYPERTIPPAPEPVAPKPAAQPVGLIAALAALTGILLGGAGGIWLALTLARSSAAPAAPANPSPAVTPVRAELQPTSSSGVQPGKHTPPPSTPANAPTGPGAGGNRPVGPPVTPRAPVLPVAAPGAGPRPLPPGGSSAGLSSPPLQPATTNAPAQPAGAGTPPVHAVAAGMSARAQLTVVFNQARGELVLTVNQGVLTSPAAPLGVPARQPLAVRTGAAVQECLRDGQGELRLLNGSGQLVFSIRKESLQWLLQGGAVAVSGLAPGDYRIASWHPQQLVPEPPFLAFNISNL